MERGDAADRGADEGARGVAVGQGEEDADEGSKWTRALREDWQETPLRKEGYPGSRADCSPWIRRRGSKGSSRLPRCDLAFSKLTQQNSKQCSCIHVRHR